MVKFEVRQLIGTVNTKWLEVVSSNVIERVAKQEYERLQAENPNEYFELVRLDINETCLCFTHNNQ